MLFLLLFFALVDKNVGLDSTDFLSWFCSRQESLLCCDLQCMISECGKINMFYSFFTFWNYLENTNGTDL